MLEAWQNRVYILLFVIILSLKRRAVVWMTIFRFSAGVRDFSLLYSVQTASGSNPVSYKMGTGSSLPGDKAAEE
jgi:hypothetical protein